jgi:hypothetical protein
VILLLLVLLILLLLLLPSLLLQLQLRAENGRVAAPLDARGAGYHQGGNQGKGGALPPNPGEVLARAPAAAARRLAHQRAADAMQHSVAGSMRGCVCCDALARLSVRWHLAQVASHVGKIRFGLFQYRTNRIELAKAGVLTCFDAALVAITTNTINTTAATTSTTATTNATTTTTTPTPTPI